MTLRRRIWLMLRQHPSSAPVLAKRHGLNYDKVSDAFKGLRLAGAIELVERRGRIAIYRATDHEPLEDGRGRSPGSADGRKLGPGSRPKVRRLTTPNEKRFDIPLAQGYGYGRIALEEVWR